MAIGWKEKEKDLPRADIAPFPENPVSAPPITTPIASTPTPVAQVTPSATPALRESIISPDLSIEGKIEGAGHVRIAGKFKGDVNVKGNLTLEEGAKLNGSVRADRVSLAGELDGNIDSAEHVDLQKTCALNGDIKAKTVTIAAGSRVKGHIECGWGDSDTPESKRNGTPANDS